MIDGTGQLVWQGKATAFGETVIAPGNAVENGLRFPGQYFERETSAHYNFHRQYVPTTGRYLESDPIGLGGGANIYGYVGGNPLNFADSKGFEPGKGERGYAGSPGGTSKPDKHWNDDPDNPGWGWEKDPQTGKKKYKKKPPYIPSPENKTQRCGDTCKMGVLVAGACVVACVLQPELCLPVLGTAAVVAE